MADQAPACPVAALAREPGILIAAHRRLDERMLAVRSGPEHVALETADRAVTDRLDALEELAARTRARSLEGAMFQLVLAKTEAEALADHRQVTEAEGLEALADHRQATEAAALAGEDA